MVRCLRFIEILVKKNGLRVIHRSSKEVQRHIVVKVRKKKKGFLMSKNIFMLFK
jgi:hypothetical protein